MGKNRKVVRRRFRHKQGKSPDKSSSTIYSAYSMSYYKLPLPFGSCEDLERLMAQLWWGKNSTELIIHWISWDNMCNLGLVGDAILMFGGL